MKITKTGVYLVAMYLVFSVVCVVWAQLTSDPKSQGVIYQLPVVLQHGLLLAIDSTEVLRGLSWFWVYALLGTPMVLVLLMVGALVDLLLRTSPLTKSKRSITRVQH